MKKIIVLVAVLISGWGLQTAGAQVNISFNIGAQPSWGPVGYDRVDYYYMPDIDVYYSVPRRQYIYLNAGQWRFASALPARYHDYNINSGYKVVINEPQPYRRAATYRAKYAGYKGNHSQQIIRNSNEEKYRGNNGNGGRGKGNEGRGNGNSNNKKGNKGHRD